MNRIIDRLKGFDIKRMFKMIKVICQRSGKSFIHILLDIFRCWIKFGSGYMDYYLFYFETLSDELKSTYINIAVNKDYIRHCNNPKYYHILNNKVEFLNTYKEFIKRDYINLDACSYDEYLNFISKHSEFMAKPVDGMCGYGIELIKTNEYDPKDLYDSLKKKGQLLLEERIKQNSEINKIYQDSINTIRIVTLNKDDNITILFRAMRIGNNGKVVDNFNNGGLMAIVEEDGSIIKPILDKNNVVYDSHPMTGTKIIGFKIPYFDQAIDLCKKLAKVTPELGMCGWDIAITEDGVDVVEGNEIPGYDIYQSREQLNDDLVGLKQRFDDAIYPERKDIKVFAKGFNFSKFIWVLFIGLLFNLVFSLININIPFFFDFVFGYIFLYKRIDSRSFKKTCLYLFLYSIFCFIINYLFINYGDLNNYDFSFVYAFNNLLPQLLRSLLYCLVHVFAVCIVSLYFVYPFIDKIVEKLPYKAGLILTIFLGIISFGYILLVIFTYISVILLILSI